MRYPREESEFDRAIAFIDATFAVPLTLLITGLDIDDRRSAFTSLSSLTDVIGPQFIAFLIAFVVIAGYWLQHHRMVRRFVALDTRNIVVNLALVASVVLLPFSTAAVGDSGVEDLPLPTVVMAINIAVVSALFTLVWVVASHDNLLDHTPAKGEWRSMVINGLVPTAVFLASIPIAYGVSPEGARIFWLSLLVFNPAVGIITARLWPRTLS
jgi:uncharacterized membrane protein